MRVVADWLYVIFCHVPLKSLYVSLEAVAYGTEVVTYFSFQAVNISYLLKKQLGNVERLLILCCYDYIRQYTTL